MVVRSTSMALAITSLAFFVSRTMAASPVSLGCYSSSDGLQEFGSYQYQSSGYCQNNCTENAGNQAVLGLTGGDTCYCGGQLPPSSDKVDDSNCNTPCTGYGTVSCGGDGFWSMYTTGNGADITSTDGSSVSGGSGGSGSRSQNSGASTRTSATPSVVTSISPGKTIVVTQSPVAAASSGSSESKKGSGGSNKTGVIVGVIIGVVALIALGVGLWFFLVRKRRQQDAEAHAGTSAAGGMSEKEWKIPSAARHTQYGRPGGGDSRLNDNVAGNRASSYSLDDSNDYTRKILTVANPDR